MTKERLRTKTMLLLDRARKRVESEQSVEALKVLHMYFSDVFDLMQEHDDAEGKK